MRDRRTLISLSVRVIDFIRSAAEFLLFIGFLTATMGEEWHEITSKTLGWVSVTCWVVFAVPQLWENYKNKKCEGLSFLYVHISLTPH